MGPLVQTYGDRLIYDTGVGRAARVSDLVEGQDWVWPPARSPVWIEILRATPLLLGRIVVEWVPGNG